MNLSGILKSTESIQGRLAPAIKKIDYTQSNALVKPLTEPIIKVYSDAQTALKRGLISLQNKGKKDCLNLTLLCKKHLVKPKAVEEILRQYPNTSRLIGDLPPGWLSSTPERKPQELVSLLNDALSGFAQKTYTEHSYMLKPNFTEATSELKSRVSEILKKDVEVEYIASGQMGKAFKLTTGGESFVVKTFHTNPKYGYDSGHWKGGEILNAVFAGKHTKKGEFADFYFGKFAREGDDDGFLVTKFIDDLNAKKYNTEESLFDWTGDVKFVKSGDGIGNRVQKTIIDYGAVSADKDFLRHPKARKINRLLWEAISNSDNKRLQVIMDKYKDTEELKIVLNKTQERLGRTFNSFDIWHQLLDLIGKKEIETLRFLGVKFDLPDAEALKKYEEILPELIKKGFI